MDSKSEREYLLLVEGLNDCHAVDQLIWLVRGAAPIFGVHECGGDNGVLESLSARLVAAEPKQKIIGVILDADVEDVSQDEVIQARLNQLSARVGTYYKMPKTFPEAGLILQPDATRPDFDRLPILGVWLMPNNKAFGMLEDLLSASLFPKVRDYTETVVDKAKLDKVANFREIHRSKAVIRTYMAWQDPPDIQYLGLAVRRQVFSELRKECANFVGWLEALFTKPS